MRSDTRKHERFLSVIKRRQVFLKQEIDADVDKKKHWVRHECAALTWVIKLAEREIEKKRNE